MNSGPSCFSIIRNKEWPSCHGHNKVIRSPILNINTLSPRQNGRHFADDIPKHFVLTKMLKLRFKLHWSLFPRVWLTINIPALLQIMAWRWSGDKLLSEPLVVKLTMGICVTRPQLITVKHLNISFQNVISFPNIDPYSCNMSVRNLTNTANIPWLLLLLMARFFSIMA